ncbi:hypothetical protein KSS87_003811 [Heliosperma pusillum]|nr:hypothetical protein KSS87_003811 [Heliosperma pusillum]
MEDTSFLFAGLKFNRNKFPKDFDVFKLKKDDNDAETNTSSINVAEIPLEEKKTSKKRKRKNAIAVEGFNVFKGVDSVVEDEENGEAKAKAKDDVSEKRKEVFRQLERDQLLRKEHNIHTSGSNVPSPLQSFEDLSVRIFILNLLLWALFWQMGRECFACAPTGSGKTLAFICPILMKLKHGMKGGVRAVVVCPTRELAAQTTRECKKFAQGKKFNIKLMTKDLAKSADFSKLPCDVLISTPIRLEYAISKRKLDLTRVEFLVLDESDKLFELGFVKQIDFVVKACSNPSIIRSLFSATLPDTVEDLARTLMHDAVRIIVGKKNTASESVKQKLVFAGSEEGKFLAVRQIFAESLNPPVLIFVQSKDRAQELYRELVLCDLKVDVVHADLPQAQRDNAVDNFRAGKTWILIATGVVDRGMDFKGLNCVINYDFPDSASTYIHRVGRCGRAGRQGEAITFYTEEDVPFLRNIANVITQSGSEVPSWIMSMRKTKWKRHTPQRDSISVSRKDGSPGAN